MAPSNPKVNFAETLTASYGAVWIVESLWIGRLDALRTARSREWIRFGLRAITAKKWWLIGLLLPLAFSSLASLPATTAL